jgi:hypothetical protein
MSAKPSNARPRNPSWGAVTEPERALSLTIASDKHAQFLLDSEQKRAQRREYAPKLYWIAVCWLLFTGAVLVASGGKLHLCAYALGLNISDAVLMTLLGTTTTAVLGLFAIFAKWLFPSDEAA